MTAKSVLMRPGARDSSCPHPTPLLRHWNGIGASNSNSSKIYADYEINV